MEHGGKTAVDQECYYCCLLCLICWSSGCCIAATCGSGVQQLAFVNHGAAANRFLHPNKCQARPQRYGIGPCWPTSFSPLQLPPCPTHPPTHHLRMHPCMEYILLSSMCSNINAQRCKAMNAAELNAQLQKVLDARMDCIAAQSMHWFSCTLPAEGDSTAWGQRFPHSLREKQGRLLPKGGGGCLSTTTLCYHRCSDHSFYSQERTVTL